MLRMTFALFVFHFVLLLVILPRNNCASVIHDSGWCLKFMIVVAMFIGFFYIPITFFQVWAEISRYVSILFLIVQVLYILVGAYTFNEWMVNSETNSENWRNMTMLCYTLTLTALTWILLIKSFGWFTGADVPVLGSETLTSNPDEGPTASCGSNTTIIVVTIVMNIIVCALRIRPDSSIFTGAMVNMWLTFLMWSALASQPSECNNLISSGWATFVQIFAHLIWTFVTMFSLASVSQPRNESNDSPNALHRAKAIIAEDAEGGA